MYLKKILIENIGPISSLKLEERDLFDGGKPKIIVLAGQNGSGKTMLLSNIIDAFHLFAFPLFDDVVPQQGMKHSYFKISGSADVKIGSTYGFSHLLFEGAKNGDVSKKYEYVEKSGALTFAEFQEKTGVMDGTLGNKWDDTGNTKNVTGTQNDKEIEKDFLLNTYCFFPVSRFEHPHWLNEWKQEKRKEQIAADKRFAGKLGKELVSESSLEKNISWILDLFLDFQVGIEKDQAGQYQAVDNLDQKDLLKKGKDNLEKIISKILKEDVELKLNIRNNGSSRLKLVRKSDKKDILPSLDNLSTGQTILLNLFSTIIRLSDIGNVNKSIHLSEIEGIVVIDEVDAHLHIDLQKNVLPELLSLFPKVQFVITSHSPFFFLGLQEMKNKNPNFNYQIIKMPNGMADNDILGVEEVAKAYELFVENFDQHKIELEKLREKLASISTPLVVTEGKTDWKHIKKALERIDGFDSLKGNNLSFHEYEESDGKIGGSSGLETYLQQIGKTGSPKILIGVFDRDEERYINMHSDSSIKKWGENVYSFCIPKPTSRNDYENISIEFYYSDAEVQSVDSDTGKRLFFSNEVNEITKKNPTNPKIVQNLIEVLQTPDSSFENQKKVYDLNVEKICDEQGKQLAHSKSCFAQNIFDGKSGFDAFNIENFKLIFQEIISIVSPPVAFINEEISTASVQDEVVS